MHARARARFSRFEASWRKAGKKEEKRREKGGKKRMRVSIKVEVAGGARYYSIFFVSPRTGELYKGNMYIRVPRLSLPASCLSFSSEISQIHRFSRRKSRIARAFRGCERMPARKLLLSLPWRGSSTLSSFPSR